VADGDYSETRSTIGWPPEFDRYVKRPTRSQGGTTRLFQRGWSSSAAAAAEAVSKTPFSKNLLKNKGGSGLKGTTSVVP